MTNFFFTDIHGHLQLFEYIVDWCLKQDPNCQIIYGGDSCDRGSHGYTIIKQLLSNSHIKFLYGNHEELFVNAATEILRKNYNDIHSCDLEKAKKILKHMRAYDNDQVKLHLANGGESTLIDWLLDGANEQIIEQIKHLPRTYSYQNFDFCHAGSTYDNFRAVQIAEQNGILIPYYDENMIIWNRSCLPLGWETERVGVFGHTPTALLPQGIYGHAQNLQSIHPCAWQDKMGAKKKRGGWKLDMDTGAYATNRAFVLNCNNSTVTGFEMNQNKEIQVIDQYQIDFS